MALQSARLRRALTSLSSFRRSISSPALQSPPPISRTSISASPSIRLQVFSLFQSRSFTASRVSLSSSGKQYRVYKEGDELTDDMVLFEGCDFNHWLITVDFPKDRVFTPEEMVATYERICAQGLNVSIEEAKKKIYACSTTTYQGFQAVMTEEESERFKDVPGVVFVLPDSYIDPQNKQYGGDKYENGVITPRPPPYQYRRAAGRLNDRNRTPNQPRYDQRGGPPPNQGGNPNYNRQSYPSQGGGGAQQSYPPQGGGYPPQGGWNDGHQQRYPPQGGGGEYAAHQGNAPQGGGNYGPQQIHPPQGGDRYGAHQGNTPQGGGNYGVHQSYPPGQGDRMPVNNSYQINRDGSYQGNYNPGHQGGHYLQDQRGFSQGAEGEFRQQTQNVSPVTQGQGANTGYWQGNPAGGQSFSQIDQGNMHGDNPPYAPPMGQSGTSQVRH